MRAVLAPMLFGLAACTSQPAVLQIYDADQDDSHVVQALVAFAQERELEVERPTVSPVRDSGVVVLYGREWVSFSSAMEIVELLEAMGIAGRAVEGRLQNHVVTRGHVAVFLDRDGDGAMQDSEASEEIRELLCSREQGEAVVLLFENHDLEIHTYIWEGETVSGQNYHGEWDATDGIVSLALDGQSRLEYEPNSACLATPPQASRPCRGTLRWLEGDAIPVFVGCDLLVREVDMGFGEG